MLTFTTIFKSQNTADIAPQPYCHIEKQKKRFWKMIIMSFLAFNSCEAASPVFHFIIQRNNTNFSHEL